MKTSIDLNCDMGESFGSWKMGRDAEIMPFISSANIACGFHAGDPDVIKMTVDLAIENNVAVGAHPSYPDLQGFGRRSIKLSLNEIYNSVLYQVSALKGFAEASGTKLHHVKPHGALYNDAASNREIAKAIVDAVKDCDPGLSLYGLSGSYLISEAVDAGLKAASEVFSDRTYQKDGSLTPRSESNALIRDPEVAARQVLRMISDGILTTVTGEEISIVADTICIHGDGENAVEIAKKIHGTIVASGIEVNAISKS